MLHLQPRIKLLRSAPLLLVLVAIATSCTSPQATAPDATPSVAVNAETDSSSEVSEAIAVQSPNGETSDSAQTVEHEQSQDAASSETVEPSPKPAEKPSPDPEDALSPGRHCFSLENAVLTETIRLNVDGASQVYGDVAGSVHNEEVGYYTGYRSQLVGSLEGGALSVDVKTWIEYDVQEEAQNWTVSSERLTTDRETLMAVDCAEVKDRFASAEGLEGSELTEFANTVHRKRVSFEPGASSATVENAVVRGDRDLYLLGAQGGQTMTLNISALEDNAVFDVVDPSGLILALEKTDEEILLPHTGDYEIIVGGTRGNASYSLTVEIR